MSRASETIVDLHLALSYCRPLYFGGRLHLHGPLYLHGALSLLCGPFTLVLGLSAFDYHMGPFAPVSPSVGKGDGVF